MELPERLEGQIIQGTEYGQIKIFYKEFLLQTIPLIADRSVQKSNFLIKAADTFIH